MWIFRNILWPFQNIRTLNLWELFVIFFNYFQLIVYLFLLAFPAVIELHQFWRFFQFRSGRSSKAATDRPRACRSIEGHILLYLKINKKIFFKLFEKGLQKGQKRTKQRQGPQKGPIWINWNGCQKYTQTWSIEWNILLDPRKKA